MGYKYNFGFRLQEKGRRLSLRMLLFIGFFAFLQHVNAQGADEQTIRAQRMKSNNAIAAHDTAALGLYWLDDLLVVTSRSISLNGKPANLRAFQDEFEKKEKLLYTRSPNIIEVFDQWNMAAESGRWTGSWILNGAVIKLAGSYYAKWHKVGGTWKIKAEMYTPLSCEGGNYCKEFIKTIDSTNSK